MTEIAAPFLHIGDQICLRLEAHSPRPPPPPATAAHSNPSAWQVNSEEEDLLVGSVGYFGHEQAAPAPSQI